MDDEKPRLKWGLRHTGLAAAVMGALQLYGITEIFYTRREAIIEIAHIKDNAAQIRADQHEIKEELVIELRELNGKLETIRLKLDSYLRAQKAAKAGAYSLETPISKNEGG